jgi:hypothetical protein
MKKRARLLPGVVSLSGLLALSAGCTAVGRHVSGWGEITLAPGDTGTCLSSPCRVFFQMPPGEGTYLVTANEIKVGDFPAGKRVSLGSFFASNAIKLPDTHVLPTYVYILGSSGDGGAP